MKSLLVVLSFSFASFAANAFDWPASGDAVIPAEAGEVVVTDENYAAVNALTSITISEGATLVFETTNPPTTALKGAGAFRKRGTAKWTVTTAQANFTGPYYVEGGIFEAGVKECFGKDDARYHIWILDGASYTYLTTLAMTYTRWMHLAGTGYENKGAFYTQGASGSYALARVKLEADTTIDCSKGYFFWGPGAGNIDMNGKTLTYRAKSNQPLYAFGGSTVNGGKMIFTSDIDYTYLCIRGFTFPADLEVVIENNSYITFFNESTAPLAKLTIPDGATVSMRHDHQFNTVVCPLNTSQTCWAGPVSLGAGSTLKIMNGHSLLDGVETVKQLGISGKISGSGSILWEAASSAPPIFLLTNPANDFTGTITIKGGRVILGAKSSIPDWSKLILQGGDVILPAEEQLLPIDYADLLAKPQVSGGHIVVDSVVHEVPSAFSGSTLDSVLEGTAARLPGALAVTNSEAGGALSAVSVKVTGPMTSPIAFMPATATSLELAGAGFTGAITLPNAYVETAAAKVASRLSVSGCGRLPVSAPLYLSPYQGINDFTLTNSVIDFHNGVDGTTYNDYTNDTIFVGMFDGNYGYHARMVVGPGSVVTGRLSVAYQPGADAAKKIFGSVIQESDSEVCSLGQNADSNYITALGYGGGFGYWLVQTNSTLIINGAFGLNQAGASGQSVFEIRGGTVRQQAASGKPTDSPFFNIGGATYTKNVIHIGKGSDVYLKTPLLSRQQGSFSVIDLAGKLSLGSMMATYYSTARAIINYLEGGVGTFAHSSRFKVSEHIASNTKPLAYYNFNGGKAVSSGNVFGVFTDTTDPNNNTAPGVTRVTVYEKGAILASTSKSNILQVSVPMEKPRGKGVVSVPWTPKGGYFGSPFVEIIGDGTNATAFAEYDYKTRTVTAITVTNPGENYTWAKARLIDSDSIGVVNKYGTVTTLETDFCTLADNVSGGVTIAAPGGVYYNVTNTYTGATVIESGAWLKLQADDVISPESDVILKGGTLYFNDKTNSFASLGGTGAVSGVPAAMKAQPLQVQRLVSGTASTLDFAGLSFAVGGLWTVSAADLVAGQTTEYAADVTFGATAKIAFTDTDSLPAAGGRYAVLTIPNGHTLTGAPTLEGTLPDGWSLETRGNSLVLRKPFGTIFLVR